MKKKEKPVTEFILYSENPIHISLIHSIFKYVMHCNYPHFGKDQLKNRLLLNVIKLFNGNGTVTNAPGRILMVNQINDYELKIVINQTEKIPIEAIKYICKHFEGMNYHYSHENERAGIFCTNDKEKRHFKNRYCIRVGKESLEYLQTENQLFLEIAVRTGADEINSMQDVYNTLMLYNGQPDDDGAIKIYEFVETE